MEYRCYSYHSSKHITKPRSCDYNIKGLELEISDENSAEILDTMIENNVLIAPRNENEKHICNVSIEYDGSVYRELIFKACSNKKLLEQVKIISEYLNGNIRNGHSTSAHIHYNKKYLQKRGIDTLDVVKSAEFLAPILYKISGRDENSIRWAKSIIRYRIEIDDDDLYKRASIVDEIDDPYDERYSIINTENYKTLELRIFSNYCNFDYKTIKLYLETSDFILDLAEFMHNKSYKNNFNECINKTKGFFLKRNRIQFYNKHNLDIFFMSLKDRQIRYLTIQLDEVKNAFNKIKKNFTPNDMESAKHILRTLRNLNSKYPIDKEFSIDFTKKIELDNLKENIINDITQKIEKISEEE